MSSSLFPPLTRDYILQFQFSSWYPVFAGNGVTIKSTIISPLSEEFANYLNSDGVFVPTGSEDFAVKTTISDDEGSDGEEEEEDTTPSFSFPELDTKIRACIKEYGAVFPKLNFSSPKDASWILPPSSPLKCTSPADIYLLLKSSDFITHDLDENIIFTHCIPSPDPPYNLELILKKWYPIDRSREVRCFVRDNKLIGISERDTNYYDFWNDPTIKQKAVHTIQHFWRTEIITRWTKHHDYVFDLLLTRDLGSAHIVDMAPYSPTTDPLLFSYNELDQLRGGLNTSPLFKVIDSRTHPAALSGAPANQHNMIPFEALSLGNGRTVEEFAQTFKDEIQKSV